MRQATLTVKQVKRSVHGEIRVEGAFTTEDSRNMLGEGWQKVGDAYVFQIRKDLQGDVEGRIVAGVVRNLWSMAVVYGVTRWYAGDADVLCFAPAPLAALMRSGAEGDGRD